MLPLDLIHILACPVCKGELTLATGGITLACRSCRTEYQSVDGIPVLLPKPVTDTVS